jgi:CheY-like chemotaxis protein
LSLIRPALVDDCSTASWSSIMVLRPLILVVDDQPIVRSVTAAVLTKAGYQILEADSADEALVVLGKRVDVGMLVTDVNMPASSMDGLELAHHVREKWPSMGIVVVSGTITAGASNLANGAVFIPKSLTTSPTFIEQVCRIAEPAPLAA